MKIVQVCPYDMARHGGVQSHIRDLSVWLRERGHEVRILFPPSGAEGRAQPGAIGQARRVYMNGTGFEASWLSTRERAEVTADLARWGAEIAHFHTPYTPLMPFRLWRALTIPRIASFHSTPPDAASFGLKTRVARHLSGWFLRRAEVSVFPAQPVCDLFSDLGSRRAPVILPPSVDLSGWQAARRDAVREGITITYLGRLEPRKGLETLLAAWPLIEAALPEARLVIAGGGSLQARVVAMSQGSPRVRHVPAPDVPEARRIVAASDFLVAPAGYGESFGLVLIEALAAGVLPLAAANAGFASVLTGPGADLLFAVGDARHLAERLVSLARDPERCASLRDWGAAHAEGFGMTAQGPQYEALYRDVLARARA